MNRGDLTREEFLRRVDLQWPDDDKINLADFIIQNNGNKQNLYNEAYKVFSLIK